MDLRTLGSAASAAALVAASPIVLALYLNAEIGPLREGAALALALFIPYWLGATLVLWAAAFVLRRSSWWHVPRQEPVPGLPGFVTLSLLACAMTTTLMWVNLVQYRHSIPVDAVRSLAMACALATLAVVILVATWVDILLFPKRGGPASVVIVLLTVSSTVVVPLALRPAPSVAEPPLPLVTTPVAPLRRVTLIGIDGMGADLVRAGVASGRLPALAAMAQEGAWGTLATLRPTEGPPIWTTIVTGRLPRDHGVKSFVRYRLLGSSTEYELLPRGIFLGALERIGLVDARPITHVARRRRALWNILNAFGIDTGVSRMWGTHPVERVRGFMLSNYFCLLPADRLGEAVHPPDLAPVVAGRITRPEDIDPDLLAEFVDLASARDDTDVPWRRELVERALAPDLSTVRATGILKQTLDPAFVVTYLYGMDPVGHTFFRYAFPDRFGNVSPEDVRRYGRVVERYAAFLDGVVGDALASRRSDEVVVVVSGYGMTPVPVPRRAVARLLGREPRSGTHASAPEGVMLMMGDGIRPGAAIRDASVLDVAPTILYLMGLPVARDMEGRVVTDALDPSVARTHRVTYIPSYESLAVTPLVPTEGSDLPPLDETRF